MDASAAASPTGLLTVSEIARLAGVTSRTVRHYHAIGLLPEPERDSSGYRRYDARDVIALVRVVRLRALGMPLPQIAARTIFDASAAGRDDDSLSEVLHGLADDLDAEIIRLAATRDRLRDLARSDTFEQPVKTLTQTLRGHGLLGPRDELPEGEGWAAALLGALHPEGMSGVLDGASELLTDPKTFADLRTLRKRFRALRPGAGDDKVAALARDVAEVLPRPDDDTPLVDMELMDKLLADRLNDAQQRFMHQLRDRVAARRSGAGAAARCTASPAQS